MCLSDFQITVQKCYLRHMDSNEVPPKKQQSKTKD
jgi:hypothetical protein